MLSKIASGLLFSGAVALFVKPELLVSSFAFLIIQEYYFSFFYSLKKNQIISSRRTRFWSVHYLLMSAFIFFTSVWMLHESLAITFFLFLTLLAFSIFVNIATLSEKKNVENWIKIENTSSVIGSCICFILLFFNHHFGWNASFLILTRLLWTQITCIYLAFRSSFSFNRYIKHVAFSARKLGRDMPSFLEGSEMVLALFLLKFLYFGGAGKVTTIGGNQLKIFMFLYDSFAAIAGLYSRKKFAVLRTDSNGQINAIWKTTLIVLGICPLFFAVEGVYLNTCDVSFALVTFFMTALTFPVFSLKPPGINLIKLLYFFSAAAMYFSSFKYWVCLAWLGMLLYLWTITTLYSNRK